mmetsp:Transcript_18716/g.34872  ORF Transcript_18716/g.34872 Transcript_18716/m.34872 type:complete len:239 (+) Transcript_18716:66-782(+)
MGNCPTCRAYCSDLQRKLPMVQTVVQDPTRLPCAGELPEDGCVPVPGFPQPKDSHHRDSDEAEVLPYEPAQSSARQDKQSDNGSDCTAADSHASTDASTSPDVGQAQQVVKNFVRTFVKGNSMNVLTVNGSATECIVSLDRKLTTISLQRPGKKDAKRRAVPLESIEEICVGDEAGDGVELPLDEFCVTLLLEDGNALAFRFNDVEERDTFALCLSMFVDGRRNEMMRKKKKKGSDGD